MSRHSLITLHNGICTHHMQINGFDTAEIRDMAQRYAGELLTLGNVNLSEDEVAVEVIDARDKVVFRIDVTATKAKRGIVGTAKVLAGRLRTPSQRSCDNDPEPLPAE